MRHWEYVNKALGVGGMKEPEELMTYI